MANSFLQSLGKLARLAWTAWRRSMQALFGAWDWEAPPWARWLVRRPRAAGCGVALALLVAAGSLYAWRWYPHRPQPDLASFAITAPGRTRIEVDNAKPEPLQVRFDRSAAALAAVGKEITDGVTLSPAIDGVWRWVDDRELEFRPRQDWPVGQTYEVRLAKGILGPAIRLPSHEFKFATAAFDMHIGNVELYQDPVNPGIKQGVFDVEFTHPVDTAEFERRIELQLAGQDPGVLGVGRETTPFTVVYDKWRLKASIHSATLPLPKNPTELRLQIGAGTRAARGGNRYAGVSTSSVRVPGLYSLSVQSVEPAVVDDDHNEAEQVLIVNLSAATGERDVAHAVKAWVLPTSRPAQGPTPAAGSADEPHDWFELSEVTGEVLAHAESLTLEPIPAEREFVATSSFRHHADVGRYLLVQVDKNLRSFGGYLSPATARFIVRVPPYPPQLKILSQGSLLALSGERKVVALVRDLPGVRVEIGRVLPSQLQHLISQSDGNFSTPAFNGSFGPDNLVERFERKIPLPTVKHGEVHYEPIDLGAYLGAAPPSAAKSDAVAPGAAAPGAAAPKRGLFLLTVRGYDPRAEARQRAAAGREAAPDTETAPDTEGASDIDAATASPGSLVDTRLVLITDLGILLKKSIDGSLDVFVQSLRTGEPVPAATVDIVAKNGTTLVSQSTDPSGRAHFAGLDGLTRERAPLFVQVTRGGDSSFLPLNRADRTLDTSRFDVGGVRNSRNASDVSAYLFSDRGVYRPGETLHVGMIAKTADWSPVLAGIPLEYDLLDARGLTVKRERFKLPAGGFTELSYATTDVAPTGTYTVNLYIVKDDRPGNLIGTTTVRVQQFEQDRMKVAARLSAESVDGWVSPRDLRALVNVANLFGTPASNRRVAASLTLSPAYPAFRSLPDYRFYDPLRAKEGYTDDLKDSTTDRQGNASFDLGLQKYARATYRVHLLVRAFEPDGGRSVAADAGVLVSDLPFLVGFKADGDLGFVSRGGARTVSLVAVDPAAHRSDAAGLTLARIETQYVSVLAKQTNGTYKYESRMKETTLSQETLTIPAAGFDLRLPTDAPGSYAYVIHDAAGLELNRIDYTVAGRGNVTRSLERNAELQITLDKKDYSPGEDIELNVKAPYTGAGLITIERDRVYATKWFKTDTTASVQRIRVPDGFEGNGYVTVQFVRDPGSDEIFTSPLSFGVAPFATSLSRRTNPITLAVPELVKPGDVLRMRLDAAHATRAVVFAVDEGILQVARYQPPDPLGSFFKKRSLEVRTSQILDLILPEFKRVMSAAAPGGDAEAALRRNLNPFKRKRDKPAVYWSGIVDVNANREFTWTVPDTFNGSLRIFAVAVNDDAVGVAQAGTVVRGDYVLTPNMPVAVAPGDEFEVSVGLANNVQDPAAGDIAVEVGVPTQLEAVGATRRIVHVDPLREAVTAFRFRARAQLGAATVVFTASTANHAARLASDVAVRPASPYATDIAAGWFGSSTEVDLPRRLYPNLRKLDVAVSAVPLVLAAGLAEYLDDYPHLCTEQLLSRGFAALVRSHRPELADPASQPVKPGAATAVLVATLRSRQNAEGGFGLWAASVDTDEFVSVYAVHWMLEARDRGEAVPPDLLQRGLDWLQRYAASPVGDDDASGWGAWRNRAYATYLLTRQGMLTTPLTAGLREQLDARYPRAWKDDVTAAFMAATYQLQKQDHEANALIGRLVSRLGTGGSPRFSRYYDDSVRDATILYLLSRHFPARAQALDPKTLQALVTPLAHGNYNTLSSALLVLGFDAYANAMPAAAAAQFSAEQAAADGRRSPLEVRGTLILRGQYRADSVKLRLTNDTGLTGFFSVSSAGYDLTPPAGSLTQGMELVREYLDGRGQPVTAVKTGDEITVRLRMRAVDRDFIPDVAVTDLLPGGFEPVLPTVAAAADGAAGAWPRFVDLRDDRVVLYGSVSKSLAEYSYRIRATNAGDFLVPPGQAESMYERQVRARSAPGRVTVEQPAAPATSP